MRHRNPGVCRTRDRRGDTGDHLERDAGGRERRRLLAAPTENERIPALEANDDFAGQAALDEQLIDLVLRATTRPFADENVRRLRGEGQERRVGEVVVDDGIGPLEKGPAPQRQEPGIPRAGADEVDDAGRVFRAHARSARSISRPPASSRRVASVSPSSGPGLPIRVSTTMALPSGVPMKPRMRIVPRSMVA
jgi:hypothetical protein